MGRGKTRRLRRRTRRAKRNQKGGAEKHAMVIVEPRGHPYLKRVIQNFDERMPRDWDLYVFHGKSHAAHAADAVKDIKGRKVFVKGLDVDDLSGGDHGGYNTMFLKKDFWNKIDAENILIFQTDTALCGKPPTKRTIDKFIKYSYIGCAVDNKHIGTHSPWNGALFYGVGGLSFRKKSFTMKCIDTPGRPTHAEDVAFSWCAEHVPGAVKPESVQVMANFCAQNTLAAETPGPFGVHKTNREFRGDKAKLFETCPEAKVIEGSP